MANSVFKPVNTIKPLQKYLDEQEEILGELSKLLDAEKTALKDRDVSNLEKLAENKSNCMLRLQSNDQRIKLHPEASTLKENFADNISRIKQKMARCQRQNDTNGRLIRLCLASSRRLSAILVSTRDRFTRNMTYTAKGNTTARGLQRVNIVA